MRLFSSLGSVLGLWLGVSFSLWLGYRLFRQRSFTRHRNLVLTAQELIETSHATFHEVRLATLEQPQLTRHLYANAQDHTRDQIQNLLNAIEAKSQFFDSVTLTKKSLLQLFKLSDYPPLSEILQIRRDFWAAAEIFLISDVRDLSAELADDAAFEAFKNEAAHLLFTDRATILINDPVAIRLSIAQEENTAFLKKLDEEIAIERDAHRIPRPKELVALPIQLLKEAYTTLTDMRLVVEDIAATARRLAQSMSVRGLAFVASDLRRVRSDLPHQFAGAFERAGGLARQGGHSLKRHYEFLIEARELRTRYAELLSRAPDLTEKGRQFLARIELERRAEQVWDSSEGLLATGRRGIVIGIAYVITGLQYVQAKITPAENKQLVVTASHSQKDNQDEFVEQTTPPKPMRVLLDSRNLDDTALQADSVRSKHNKRNLFSNDTSHNLQSKANNTANHSSQRATHFDITHGNVQVHGSEAHNNFRKGRASLVDRLSAIDGQDEPVNKQNDKTSKNKRFRQSS